LLARLPERIRRERICQKKCIHPKRSWNQSPSVKTRSNFRKRNEEAGRIAAPEKIGESPRIQNTQEKNAEEGKIADLAGIEGSQNDLLLLTPQFQQLNAG
jgi:hypothetical protein